MVTTRRFELHRDHDVSGVSGTGVVADGVRWPDGSVSIRWRGERPSVVFWHSLDDAEQVHGHGGATRFVWLDGDPTATTSMPTGDEAYRRQQCEWLRANGIDPDDVPMDATIDVHGGRITVDVVVRDRDGNTVPDGSNRNSAAHTKRTVPLLVPFPEVTG